MERKRHFFKVLIPGFHQRLNLPSAVSKELETQKSRRATLQSCKGTWEITMSKNYENNLLCFDQGWSEFVESHALHLGDFLVFEHTRNLHFDVLVFDSTACEKRFHVEPKMTMQKKDGNSEEALNPTMSSRVLLELKKQYNYLSRVIKDCTTRRREIDVLLKEIQGQEVAVDRDGAEDVADGSAKKFRVEAKTTTATKKKNKDGNSEENLINSTKKRMRGGGDGDGSPYFVKKMSPSFAAKDARVNIPVEFMRTNGLGEKSSVRLRDPNNGKEWSVDLSTETTANEEYRNRMCGEGWHHFYVSNKLKNGDTCVFKLRRRLLTSTTIFLDVYFPI